MARSKKYALTDEELRAICEREIWSASGDSAELSDQRAKAMRAYLGEPQGDEMPGRSQVRTREVFETVEWLMPSLMRIFRDADNVCAFDPIGPEDEAAAQQETDAIEHIFFSANRGFTNLYSFIKDGLMQKTGILKVWYDATPAEEREEYESLTEWELTQLIGDEANELEVIDFGENADGTYSLTLIRKVDGKIVIEPCPPEEFGLDRDARSIYPEDAGFVFHRSRKTKGELIEAGHDRDTVEELPAANDTYTYERTVRRHLSDEQDREQSDHWSMQRVWITECYIRIDRDDDGVNELLKVTLAGADSAYTSGSHLLDIEEIDRQPFCVWSPVILTHKFYGLSCYDVIEDLQQIQTALMRGVLDNTYLANNGRTVANERVNIDDLQTSRPGGIVRVQGKDTVPSNALQALPNSPLPPQTFEVMDRQESARKQRMGVGDEVGSLDTGALAQLNTGVAAMAFDAARSKIELMAAICAEVGLRPLFLRIHELLRKHGGSRKIAMKLRGKWEQVQPQTWRDRTDMTVQVGVGLVSRERRVVALADVLEKQSLAMQSGGLGTVLTPAHLYNTVVDYTKALGLDHARYWANPEEMPPQEPQPDPQAELMQLQMQIAQAQVQDQQERTQLEAAKLKSDYQLKMMEMQRKGADDAAKREIEALKADLARLDSERDSAVAESKLMLDAEIATREQELSTAQMRLKDQQEAAKRETDILKTLIASGATPEQMRTVGVEAEPEGLSFEELMEQVQAQNETITATQRSMKDAFGAIAQMMDEQKAAPTVFERDESGQVVSVNGKPVKRNASGLIEGIG